MDWLARNLDGIGVNATGSLIGGLVLAIVLGLAGLCWRFLFRRSESKDFDRVGRLQEPPKPTEALGKAERRVLLHMYARARSLRIYRSRGYPASFNAPVTEMTAGKGEADRWFFVLERLRERGLVLLERFGESYNYVLNDNGLQLAIALFGGMRQAMFRDAKARIAFAALVAVVLGAAAVIVGLILQATGIGQL